MKTPEVTPKALTAWVGCAMLGPLALNACRFPWLAVMLAGVLCTLLCTTIHGFSDGRIWQSKPCCAVLCLWNLYAAGAVASQAAVCWPGRGSNLVVPLVLLLLAAISAWNGADRASRVAATVCPLCVLVFAVVLACGVSSVRWERLAFSDAAPGGMLLFVFLLPIAATGIPRVPGLAIGRCMAGLTAFAVLVSLTAVGALSLPVALTRGDAFYQFARSIRLFSAVQRFESVAAVAVTCSIYAMLSLLLSGGAHLAEEFRPGWGRWAVALGAGAGAAAIAGGAILRGRELAAVALLIWGILPLMTQLLPCGKNPKKDEKTS